MNDPRHGSAALPTTVEIMVVRSEHDDGHSTRQALAEYLVNAITVVPDVQTVLTSLAHPSASAVGEQQAPRAGLVLTDAESAEAVTKEMRAGLGLHRVPVIVLNNSTRERDFDGLVAAVKEIDDLRISVLTFADRRRRPR